jgi:hypothetical protein
MSSISFFSPILINRIFDVIDAVYLIFFNCLRRTGDSFLVSKKNPKNHPAIAGTPFAFVQLYACD